MRTSESSAYRTQPGMRSMAAYDAAVIIGTIKKIIMLLKLRYNTGGKATKYIPWIEGVRSATFKIVFIVHYNRFKGPINMYYLDLKKKINWIYTFETEINDKKDRRILIKNVWAN